MNPFLPGGSDGQIPYTPVDIPTPETPAPDFKTIGQTFAAAGTAARKEAAKDDSNFDWLWRQLVKAVKAVLSSIVDLFTLVLSGILDVLDGSHGAMDRLAQVVLSGMFGLESATGSWANLKDATSRHASAEGITSVFRNALGSGQGASGELKPGHAGADAFLKAVTHMAIEGWLLGWVVELADGGQLETFAELKDIIESSLGLGRLSRRALAPPMKVLVEDPYTWELNQTYHPTLLTAGEAVRFYLRGGIDRAGLQKIMDLHGYASTLVDELIWDNKAKLPPADIQMLVDTKQLTQEQAVQRLNHQGYDNTDAVTLLQAIQQGKITAEWRHQLEVLGQLYIERKLPAGEWRNFVDQSQLPAWQKDIMVQTIQFKAAANRTRFTMGEGELLVKKGLWNLNEFRDLATYHGYSPEDERDLELLLLVEIKDAADAASKRAAAEQARKDAAKAHAAAAAAKALQVKTEIESKGVSQAQYETLVEEGLRSFQQYHAYLTSKGIAIDNADALVTVLGNKLASKKAAAALKAAAAGKAKARALDVSQLESAVKQGLISLPEFIARMEQIGMSATDAQLLGQELQGQIDSAAVKEKAAAAAKAAAAVKRVDLGQEERAVRLGLQTIQQYAAFLDAQGFEPHDRDVLVAVLGAQLAADQQTAAQKQAAAAKASQKGIPLAQLERLVRAGIKQPADYQAALAAAGVDAADQAALMQFLDLQMQQDQQDLIVHGNAAGLVGQLGPSLADLARAVKLGVIPIDGYQDALQRAGVAAADQQTLVKNLAAEIKATRAQQSTTKTVAKQVAAAGVSLGTLERDVLRGVLLLEQFEGLLAGYGVPAAQVMDVVALLKDQIANQQAIQTLVNQAAARAAAKGLNLAEDTAAFKQGVMSEYEWRQRVADLGYDAADVEILFETLAAQQAAVAAKSAKKSSQAGAATTTTTSTTTTGG